MLFRRHTLTRKEIKKARMRFSKAQSYPFMATFAGPLIRVSLCLLLCFLLAACFGSSDSDKVAEAVPDTPTPQAQPTAAPTATVSATVSDPAPTASDAVSNPASDPASNTVSNTNISAQVTPVQQASKRQLFQIDPEQSEARFIVDEVLFGNPNTVTGRTNKISGQIEIDLNDPTQTSVGEIQIDARGLATDNRFRNRSLSRLILQSNRDEYQYITFTPTAITGLPAKASAGDAFTFQITGDLKIRDTVKPVTFDVNVKADSDKQVSGLAQAVVQRADFGLTIPKVEGVADVTEEVHLELQFIATASE
jgi:polyisoprenoid-binding protein YceI